MGLLYTLTNTDMSHQRNKVLYCAPDSVGKLSFSVIASAFCEAIFPGLLRHYAPRNDTGRVFRHCAPPNTI